MNFGGWNHEKNESNRATDARERNLLSIQDLKKLLAGHNFRGLTIAEIGAFFPESEWHHVGNSFREVKYYERADVAQYLNYESRRALKNFIKYKKEEKKHYEFFKNNMIYEPRYALIDRFK